MIEGSHDIYLLDEALFAIVLTVGRLLRERLHRIAPTILRFIRQVNRCEISFPYFLFGFELLMEAPLVEPRLEHFSTVSEVAL